MEYERWARFQRRRNLNHSSVVRCRNNRSNTMRNIGHGSRFVRSCVFVYSVESMLRCTNGSNNLQSNPWDQQWRWRERPGRKRRGWGTTQQPKISSTSACVCHTVALLPHCIWTCQSSHKIVWSKLRHASRVLFQSNIQGKRTTHHVCAFFCCCLVIFNQETRWSATGLDHCGKQNKTGEILLLQYGDSIKNMEETTTTEK